MKNDSTFDKIAIKYGLLTFLGLIAYFLVMKLVGLMHIVELRVLNLFILSYGVWLAIKQYIKDSEDKFVYLQTLALGVFVSLVAVLPFAIFIFFYMTWDAQFMQMIIANEWFGEYLNPYIISFLIFFEGILSGFFIAYTLMQYMKKSLTTST